MVNNLANKNILLGVTGGIAAYKSAELLRQFRQQGANVRVAMTQSAQAFITPLTLQALSGYPVHTTLLDPAMEGAMGHIQLARWSDVVVVAPASANFTARLTQGLADDLLTTLCLATQGKVLLAPAMNQQMWQDKATQTNIATLKSRQITIIGPGVGEQACGDIGPGRMEAPEKIVVAVNQLFETGALAGQSVLITAGPTQEAIDPVRYISNRSSGKMGYAMANAAVEAGAKVIVISGPTHLPPPEHTKFIQVLTAQQMHQAVMAHVEHCDIVLGIAAVSDYRCDEIASHKLEKREHIPLNLVKNPDIIANVAKLASPPFTVGFAAQTHDVLIKARQKLTTKNLHGIIANVVGKAGCGFDSDDNEVTLLWRDSELSLPLMNKQALARQLITLIARRYQQYDKNKIKSSR